MKKFGNLLMHWHFNFISHLILKSLKAIFNTRKWNEKSSHVAGNWNKNKKQFSSSIAAIPVHKTLFVRSIWFSIMAKLLALNSTIILCVIILTLDEMVSHFDIWNVHVMWIWNLIGERGTQILRLCVYLSSQL